MIGSIVGSYRIVDLLGAGGMGEVYRGEHLHLDRPAAIKMLRLELSRDREALDRFFAEARATSLIRHPGIVEVFDCNVHDDGRVYLVMELLTGETLSGRLGRDAAFGRDVYSVLDIADQIASALGAAHHRGIVHRDVKPENIFLVDAQDPPEGRESVGDLSDARRTWQRSGLQVKVLDFGIAKLVAPNGRRDESGRLHTRNDRILGTPQYMSPEQCRDAGAVDHRTDVYSLGCVLFEMASGRVPFRRSTFGELVTAHLWEPAPSLREVNPGVAASIDALVARMLAKDPSARPDSMDEVRLEIARAKRSTGWNDALNVLRLPGSTSDERSRPARATGLAPVRRVLPAARRFVGNRLRSKGFAFGMAGVGCLALAAVTLNVAVRDRAAAARPRGGGIAAAAPPLPVRPRNQVVRVDVADAPPGLSVVVDGRSAGQPPVELPAGPTLHDVVFRADGYHDLQVSLDGKVSRRLTLGMLREPSAAPTADASAPAVIRADDRKMAAPLRHPRRPAETASLSDELRKL